MSFLASKPKLPPAIPPKENPPTTEVVRNPLNRVRPRRKGTGSGIQSILTAGLGGNFGGSTTLGGR